MILLALIVLLMALLCTLGMVKWYSVLFSDGRGKLGDQVVFSNWKGRPYMRAYARPANPNTLKQQAQRAVHTEAVKGWQTNVGTDVERLGAWNELALTRQISGFNLWMKYCDEIDISAEEDDPPGNQITVTYTIPSDVSIMGLYRNVAGTITRQQTAGDLAAGVDQTWIDTDPTHPATNEYFIAPASLFDDLAGADQVACKCAHWTPNETTGVADPASVVLD